MRVLGIDHGERRFGVAISDPEGIVARPLEVVDGERALLDRVEELVRTEEVGLIVIGLPLNMDGSTGKKANRVLDFRERLSERIDVEVELWDERLTTLQAERYLRESGLSAGKRRSKVDKVAAQIILQSFLASRQVRE